MMILKSIHSLPLMAVFLMSIIQESHGYASWLKCYVELDETEIVMNHHIVPAHKADYTVDLEIKPEGYSDWLTSHVVYIQPSIESVKVRLKVPPALQDETVQYVVETTEGALFADSPMCDGKRAYARDYDTEVVLKFNPDFHETHLEIWAGWAMGHEEVRLTPRLKLERREEQPEL
mmetsp:Transcript_14202/g.19871  ORF Transcript_14202/g.19871 Transcript_14202/m.19871 type:complete len:176 (-) Transcript_14202:218-745(-)